MFLRFVTSTASQPSSAIRCLRRGRRPVTSILGSDPTVIRRSLPVHLMCSRIAGGHSTCGLEKLREAPAGSTGQLWPVPASAAARWGGAVVRSEESWLVAAPSWRADPDSRVDQGWAGARAERWEDRHWRVDQVGTL